MVCVTHEQRVGIKIAPSITFVSFDETPNAVVSSSILQYDNQLENRRL